MIVRRAIILAFLCIFLSSASALGQEYGLFFASYDSLKDRRTGIDLFPDKSPTFRDRFELSFDIALHETESFNFGYVFRAILNGNHNIDLLYRFMGGQDVFNIVNLQEQTDIFYGIEQQVLRDKWVRFRIEFLLSEDKIVWHYQDTTFVHEHAGFENPSRLNLYFGANFKSDFATTEVPPIKIRDVKIVHNSKVVYHWPLDEFSGEMAKELNGRKPAKVYNPVWLMMGHMQWSHIRDITVKGYAKIIADHPRNRLYILGQKELITFDIQSGTLDTVTLPYDPFLFISHYQGVFDGKHIISYNQNAEQLIKIDPETGAIDNLIKNDESTRRSFLHHNKYLDTANHLLYVLNGYGHYTYSNALLICNIETNEWVRVEPQGDVYAPRYLAASGFMNDTLYVLGGYGSKSGDQRLNPQYFYDFNTIALDSFNYSTKWSYAAPENDFCFANSLVIDSTSRSFYTLSFPKHRFESQLQLIKGSLDHPEFEKIGEPIPYQFNDINSYADLIYFSEPGKLIAVDFYSKDYSSSLIGLYSMNYPPLAQTVPDEGDSTYILYIGYVMMGLIVVGILLVAWKRRRKRHSKVRQLKKELSVEEARDSITKNAIFFFGGFQVKDREGNDITKKFTKLLKELFLYIFFKSTGDSKGISPERLIEMLWFDKDVKSGRNNLSVNIAKLKDILKEMDGCTLDHKTGYWKLILDTTRVFVEYLDIQKILDSKKETLTIEALATLLGAANRGQFLVNLDYEWLDRYKGQVSDRMVDTLISYAESLDPKTESSLIIQIANSVFSFDTVNEEAMLLKCRTQSILGKHSLSRKTFENFCKEYEILYGEPFNRPFGSIINKT
jgi:two-component SAPR family response regulator